MKRLYPFVIFCIFWCSSSLSAQVLSFTMAGCNGDESSWPSCYSQTTVAQASLTRGPGISSAANADRFNSIGWTTATTLDADDYLQFTVTPTNGYAVTITSLQLQHQRSTTGPTRFVVRTSMDNYATDATNTVIIADVNTFQNHTFTLNNSINTTAAVTFRIYAFAAENALGSWGPGVGSNDELTVFGTLHILPVHWTQFKAVLENQNINLAFSNLAEADVIQYYVEQSVDGQNFKVIASIVPTANNDSRADYTYTVHHPSSAVLFYRICALEATGRNSYTNIIKVNKQTNAGSLSITTNPVVNGQLSYQLSNVAGGTYAIQVFGTGGQVLYHSVQRQEKGIVAQTINVSNLKPGLYYLQVTGEGPMVKSFIVR